MDRLTKQKEEIHEALTAMTTEIDGEVSVVTRWATVLEFIDPEDGHKGIAYFVSDGVESYDAKMLFEIGQGIMIAKMNKGV